MKKITIAIDGYASCGKSTTARLVAERLKYIYIDSGAMYRAFTLFVLRKNIPLEDTEAIKGLVDQVDISFSHNPEHLQQEVTLNGEMVESQIRTREVSQHVSTISALREIRAYMVARQQALGWHKGVVMDGRDIGTVVFPKAELKIFMNASLDERVRRRQQELEENGYSMPPEEIRLNLQRRDYLDSVRRESPLRKARDARLLLTTHLEIEEQVDVVVKWAKEVIEG